MIVSSSISRRPAGQGANGALNARNGVQNRNPPSDREWGGAGVSDMRRQLLLASVAAGALALAAPGHAVAPIVPPFTATSTPCSVTGIAPDKIVICTGSIPAGVHILSPTSGYSQLLVNSVTGDIIATVPRSFT